VILHNAPPSHHGLLTFATVLPILITALIVLASLRAARRAS
jgi:hypothetical protein